MTVGRMLMWAVLAVAIMGLCLTAGVSFGAAPIPFTTVWSIIANKLSQNPPDIFLRPPVSRFRALDFLKIDQVMAETVAIKDELKRAVDEILLVLIAFPLLVLAVRHWQQQRRQPIPLWLQQQLLPFARKAPQLTMQQFLQQLSTLFPQANEEIQAVDLSYQRLMFAEETTVLPQLKRQTKQLVYTLRQQGNRS